MDNVPADLGREDAEGMDEAACRAFQRTLNRKRGHCYGCSYADANPEAERILRRLGPVLRLRICLPDGKIEGEFATITPFVTHIRRTACTR